MPGRPASSRPGRFEAAVRAELSKLLSLPAAWLTLAATAVVAGGLAVPFSGRGAQEVALVTPLDVAMTPMTYAHGGFFVLGIVTAGSEYSGQLRTTLLAEPRRFTQRLAATAALVPVAFVAGLIVTAAGVAVTALRLGGVFADPAALARVVCACAAYLAFAAVLGSAVAVLLRRTLPAAALVLSYLVVVSPLLIEQPWRYRLPDLAAFTLWFPTSLAGAPSAPVAWATVAAWTLAAFMASLGAFRRRDA